MPLDGDGGWDRNQVLTAREILDAISAVYPLERVIRARFPRPRHPLPLHRRPRRDRHHPHRHRTLLRHLQPHPPHGGRQAPPLFFAVEETDLKSPMRAGATDDELAWLFVGRVRAKWPAT